MADPRPTSRQPGDAAGTDCAFPRVGVVAIGRNEGERLRRCLQSVVDQTAQVVYVDSGSTDGSVRMASELGVAVVALDMSRPFTAARARNEGFRCLMELAPHISAVQFIDGDCEVVQGWLSTAWQFLRDKPLVAVVCGRRRERFPQRSVYNALCDIEWNTPVGQATACGGDALMRVSAFVAVGGYRDDLIAGEEPELCVRIRAAGFTVWRLDAEMTLHDAAMTRFSQWWSRTQRGGFAFAHGAAIHGASPERHWVVEARRGLVWGLALPVAIALLAIIDSRGVWIIAMLYPLQVVRLAWRARGTAVMPWTRAFFLVLGKFAEATGQCKYWWRRWRGGPARLIEYK